jgi:hypothetical protein
MPSSDDLKKILDVINPDSFDKIVELFIKDLTDSDKLFKPNKLGVERFAIFYYSHLFLMPETTYFNKQQTTTPTITSRKNYFKYLINFTIINKNSTIKLLFKMLINDKNYLRIKTNLQQEKFRINIHEEYDKYCFQHNLISFSSKSRSRSTS